MVFREGPYSIAFAHSNAYMRRELREFEATVRLSAQRRRRQAADAYAVVKGVAADGRDIQQKRA